MPSTLLCSVISTQIFKRLKFHFRLDHFTQITLTVLVATIDAIVGDVGSVRYELALLPPCLSIRVLSYSKCPY